MEGQLPIWLLLSLMMEFGFGQLFKWAEQKGCHAPTVVTTNYLVLASILLIFLWFTGRLQIPPAAVGVGAITGAVFISSMSLMTHVLRLLRVASVLTAFRLSIVVPVGLGVLLWDEPLSGLQILGLGMALVALLLMSRHAQHRTAVRGLKALALLAMIFVLQGMSTSCLRWVHYAGLDPAHLQVLMVIGFTAGTIGGTVLLWEARQRIRRFDLAVGAGIGVYNLLALTAVLIALKHMPGTVFFPLVGCGVVILDNVTAPLLWKEPISRAAVLGVGVGVLAVILVVQ
jgi:drug/metabolite transporter (DMT)-like permease